MGTLGRAVAKSISLLSAEDEKLVSQLLAQYNKYRMATADVHARRSRGEYVRELTMTGRVGGELVRNLCEMIPACRERSLDPALWLYSLFKSRVWSRSPNANQLSIFSEKNLRHYHLVGAQSQPMLSAQMRQQVTESRAARGDTGYDQNRDLTPGAEALKRRFSREGDYERCMEGMSTSTLGYHPKSIVCSQCPIAESCALKLRSMVPFDIIALRRGDITSEQAKDIAWRTRSHGC